MSDDDRVTSDVEWLVVERLRLELTDGGALCAKASPRRDGGFP